MILALAAAAVLALAGCGGGGETAATTASAPGSGPGAAKSQGEETSSSSSSSSSGKDQGSGASSSPASKSPPATPGPGAKQGPSIAAPKGERERGPTPAEEAEATVADIALWSPALGAASAEASALPSTYTCDGKDSWPELRWQGIPPDTKELALLAMSVAPVEGKLVFNWALAGLDPSLESLEAGRLPKGAITGQNSFGHNDYEICPNGAETYVFALFALPQRLSPRPGFDPHAFREQVLGVSGNVGLLAVSYARG